MQISIHHATAFLGKMYNTWNIFLDIFFHIKKPGIIMHDLLHHLYESYLEVLKRGH